MHVFDDDAVRVCIHCGYSCDTSIDYVIAKLLLSPSLLFVQRREKRGSTTFVHINNNIDHKTE